MNRHRVTTILALPPSWPPCCLPGTASAASYDFPLSGYWPLNEGKGQVVRDWSGNGNHGQLGSTPGVDANDPSWIKGAFFWSSGCTSTAASSSRSPTRATSSRSS